MQDTKHLNKAESTRRKKRATAISTAIALFLMCAKFLVFFVTGSLALLASAIDSLLDLLISFSNYFIVKNAEHNATENYRFGFGRLEEIAGLFQGLFVIFIGIGIIFTIASGDYIHHQIQHPEYVLWVMGLSLLISIAHIRFLNKESKATRSSVLEADAGHYRADMFSNSGIFFGIILVILTGWDQVDSILCIVMALFIIKDGVQIALNAFQYLLDKEAEPEIINKVITILELFVSENAISGYHNLRSRKTGSKYFAEVHLEFNGEILLKDAHTIAHQVEDKVAEHIPRLELTVHLDPENDADTDQNRLNA
jgi:ferrous-iron efflux pump FieF